MVAFGDLHVDFKYKKGTNSNCGRLICCRDGEGDAGEWGHPNCDLPEKTMLNMFDFIDREIKPNFVVWGGGSVPRDFEE